MNHQSFLNTILQLYTTYTYINTQLQKIYKYTSKKATTIKLQ